MAENPPYVNNYGQIPTILEAIRKAKTPPKFTQDFIYSVLGLKSKSFRTMIPIFKKLGLTDQGSIPTQDYKDFRGANHKVILAKCVKKSYPTLYQTNEFVHKLEKKDLTGVIKTATGLSESDQVLNSIVNTFSELCDLSDFEGEVVQEEEEEPKEEKAVDTFARTTKLGISYTINLNLPATTEIEVFNAIFKSLKENILHE